MAPRRRDSKASPAVPATPARCSSRIRGLPAAPTPDLDSIPRPSTRRRARAPARRTPTLPPPPPSSSPPRSDPQKRQPAPSTAAPQQPIEPKSAKLLGSSPALALQPPESSSDSDSSSDDSSDSASSPVPPVSLPSGVPQEATVSSTSFSRSPAPSPPESLTDDTSQAYEETDPDDPDDQSVITGDSEFGDYEEDDDEPDLINKDQSPASDVDYDVVDFFDNVSPRHSRQWGEPSSDSNDKAKDDHDERVDDNDQRVDGSPDDDADPGTNADERRRYVRLTLSIQRGPDERPQDIELHIYDDWPQPIADGAIILTFEGKPVTAQVAGNSQKPRGHGEASGSRRTFDAPTPHQPRSQKRSRDAGDEGDGDDSDGDGAPRTPKRRHISVSDGEGQRPVFFGEPTNTVNLGHVDLDDDDDQEGPVPAEPILPEEANNTWSSSVIDRLQSICRKIRQSFSHLPAVAASIRDLPSRVWNAILSQAARLLRAVPRGRLAITAGVITAVAVAIYFARDSSLPMPKFKELDYFEQTDMLFHLYSAVPPVLVLGELDVIEHVKNLYGLELNTNPVLDGQLANTTDFQPRGEPWSQDADGKYVPEPVFVHSFADAIDSFFKEQSMYQGAGFLQPDRTPAPAARQHPPCRHLVEKDLSLDMKMVSGRVRRAMNAFVAEYDRAVPRMHKPETNGMGAAERHLSVRTEALNKIGHAMRNASSDYGGSDKERLACLRERERDASAPPVDCDGGLRERLLFPWRQLENETATDLLAMNSCHLNRFGFSNPLCVTMGNLPTDELGPYIRPYEKAIDTLIYELGGLRTRLIDIYREIFNLPPPAQECIDAEVGRTCTVNCVTREFEKMVFLLEKIAIPRLEAMQRRVEISMMILDKAEARRVRLSNTVFPQTNSLKEDRWMYWLPSWPDLKIPVLPSLDSIRTLSRDSQDSLQIRREDFERRVAQSEKSDAKYKSNDKEKWFHDCSKDCKAKPLPQLLPKDMKDFLYKTTVKDGSQTVASGKSKAGKDTEAEATTSPEWWEKRFPWLREQERG